MKFTIWNDSNIWFDVVSLAIRVEKTDNIGINWWGW